jgi:hypothetical protein
METRRSALVTTYRRNYGDQLMLSRQKQPDEKSCHSRENRPPTPPTVVLDNSLPPCPNGCPHAALSYQPQHVPGYRFSRATTFFLAYAKTFFSSSSMSSPIEHWILLPLACHWLATGQEDGLFLPHPSCHCVNGQDGTDSLIAEINVIDLRSPPLPLPLVSPFIQRRPVGRQGPPQLANHSRQTVNRRSALGSQKCQETGHSASERILSQLN